MIKSYTFLDFETTGLDNPEITEVCVLSSNKIDERIKCSLHLCCKPVNKSIEDRASEITGLTDNMLTCYKPFIPHGINIVRSFLKLLPKPVCLLAHNGDNFDFKLLKDALKSINKKLPDGVVLVDTLPLFREIVSIPAYNLEKIYEHIFLSPPNKSHTAFDDCETLVKCFYATKCDEHILKNYEMVH